MRVRAVAIVGPTAVGKSTVALALAERLGGEIVNADALQVYRGLEVGTAKPDRAARRRVRHHLLDILDPHQPFSAGDFARRARQVLAELEHRGVPALVVGGSGLYLRALVGGLAAMPPVPAAVRAVWQRRLERDGLEALRRELARRDPETHARLAPGDRQRILRALEVADSSGRPLSRWLAGAPRAEPLDVTFFGLTLARPVLYDRIARRVEAMLATGWVEEVRGLLASGVDPSVPAFQAIGYRQIVRHLGGELSLAETGKEIVVATRRYAKRQLTWFRKQPGIRWVGAGSGAPERLERWLADGSE